MKTKTLLPVLFGFFIMGFCDVVGISSSYVKQDFSLSDTAANFLPSMLFIWFFVFSVPVGLLMNKIGRKDTVLLSMVFTAVAMIIPFIAYTYTTTLLAFAMLGIGNTIIQVSLNPLLTNVVAGNRLTSALTAGQFVKAISSFCGPVIAAWAAVSLGNWQLIFPIFAAITLVSMIWLWATVIPAETAVTEKTSLGATFKLLGDKNILMMFIGILCAVGVDVGMNTMTPRLLMERCGIDLAEAGYGTSLYFAFRTAGAFMGAFLLARIYASIFFKISSIVALIALVVLFFVQSQVMILSMVAIIGFAVANIFPIIFGAALEKRPEQANEISGLMIMGVSGGAIMPPLMGVVSSTLNSQSGSVVVIAIGTIYLLAASFLIKKKA